MSLEATKAVWERSKARVNARLILLAIADYADRDGRAYPSQSQLAEKTGLSRRAVQRILDRLEESGELIVEEHGVGRQRTKYRVGLIRVASNTHNPPVANDATEASTRTDDMSRMTPQRRQPEHRNKEEQLLDSHITASEQESVDIHVVQEAPQSQALALRNPSSDGDFTASVDAAVFLLPYIAMGRIQNNVTIVASAIDALMVRGSPSRRDAMRVIYVKVARYRKRQGLKETRYFLSDGTFLEPEETWLTHGNPTHAHRSNQARETQQQRYISLIREAAERRSAVDGSGDEETSDSPECPFDA